MKNINDNRVTISGRIITDLKYSHTIRGEKFYYFEIESMRHSGTPDMLKVLISGRIIDASTPHLDEYIRIWGSFRSYTMRRNDGSSKLQLYVFVDDYSMDDVPEPRYDDNVITMDGYICKDVVYRKTPLNREISDLLIAVNRSYGNTDYLPCLCWGRSARYAESLQVGTHVSIEGRVQSRSYHKKLSEDEVEERVAYEISVACIDVIEDEETDAV